MESKHNYVKLPSPISSPTRKQSTIVDTKDYTSIPKNDRKEFIEFAKSLGADVVKHPELIEIVWKALKTDVPDGWEIILGAGDIIYFHNKEFNISRWEHPMDHFYKALVKEELKEKKKKKKKCTVM